MITLVILVLLLVAVLVLQVFLLRVVIQILDQLRVLAARIQEIRNRWRP